MNKKDKKLVKEYVKAYRTTQEKIVDAVFEFVGNDRDCLACSEKLLRMRIADLMNGSIVLQDKFKTKEFQDEIEMVEEEYIKSCNDFHKQVSRDVENELKIITQATN